MKLALCVVSLSAMLMLPSGVYSSVHQLKVDLPCFSSTKPGSEEIKEYRNLVVPKTRGGKCLYKCILSSVGVVKEDALIDVEKFMNSLRTLSKKTGIQYDEQSLNMTTQIMENCKGHKHLSEDKCETTALLLDCAVEESKRRGWEPTQIAKLIEKQQLDIGV